jgi:hypothetical protein
MARTIAVVESVTVTDDITGQVFSGVTGDMGEWMDVQSYRVTFERIDANGEVVSTAFTKDVDMHDYTFTALESFINRDSDRNMFELLLSIWKMPTATVEALWAFITGGIVANLLSVLGAKPKPATNGTNKTTNGNPYTAYVRAYAIAHKWVNAAGKEVSTHGKMSVDVIVKFQTKTGITPDKFANGERVSVETETPAS